MFRFLLLLSLSLLPSTSAQGCGMLSNCNGHGTCTVSTGKCSCYEGWGADTDIAYYKAPDCSKRVCPAGRAWGDVPTSATSAHALIECSNRGTCDRGSGACTCFDGFAGDACQCLKCPNDCSGHGQCLNVQRLASMTNAEPLSNATTYAGFETTHTWDEDMVYGCPSGNDPRTAADETDCGGKAAKWSTEKGRTGNKCHVDCSNRGVCDYRTGTCACFVGYFGQACNEQSALATGG
ncbi:hypothetical protein TL16_g04532 [Triparma laevis f. inornata]|uniref:EGF-like domain-containing protein n=1 Tax=Triparma laevis f. inornata TaxID=1714386 RepID=A0A9W7AAU7_9STRA|nr:hypothetical protein TL16_g04532 [Triparma laevis f. inornata]